MEDPSDNQERFVAICSLLGHDIKIVQPTNLKLESYEVMLSCRKQVEIRRLKQALDRDGVDYGIASIGRNTRYYAFRCSKS